MVGEFIDLGGYPGLPGTDDQFQKEIVPPGAYCPRCSGTTDQVILWTTSEHVAEMRCNPCKGFYRFTLATSTSVAT
eukprot:g123.t1